MYPQQMNERWIKALKLFRDGASYGDIAQTLKVSKTRASQIVRCAIRREEELAKGGTIVAIGFRGERFLRDLLGLTWDQPDLTKEQVLPHLAEIRFAIKTRRLHGNLLTNTGQSTLRRIEEWLDVEPEITPKRAHCPTCSCDGRTHGA